MLCPSVLPGLTSRAQAPTYPPHTPAGPQAPTCTPPTPAGPQAPTCPPHTAALTHHLPALPHCPPPLCPASLPSTSLPALPLQVGGRTCTWPSRSCWFQHTTAAAAAAASAATSAAAAAAAAKGQLARKVVLQEAALYCSMSHPNVVATYDYDVLIASAMHDTPSGLHITDQSGDESLCISVI